MWRWHLPADGPALPPLDPEVGRQALQGGALRAFSFRCALISAIDGGLTHLEQLQGNLASCGGHPCLVAGSLWSVPLVQQATKTGSPVSAAARTNAGMPPSTGGGAGAGSAGPGSGQAGSFRFWVQLDPALEERVLAHLSQRERQDTVPLLCKQLNSLQKESGALWGVYKLNLLTGGCSSTVGSNLLGHAGEGGGSILPSGLRGGDPPLTLMCLHMACRADRARRAAHAVLVCPAAHSSASPGDQHQVLGLV